MRKDHELSVPEMLEKIEKLIGLIRIKAYGEGFEEGREFEREASEANEKEVGA